MKYIATREGVEVLTGKGPTTEKQKELIAKLLKDFGIPSNMRTTSKRRRSTLRRR